MAHEIYKIGDEDSMAFVGETPWHGLGQELEPNQPLEVWAEKAHLDWKAIKTDVKYRVNHFADVDDETKLRIERLGNEFEVPDRQVIYRSDNLMPLGIVSNRYKPVQPIEVLEFFRDLIDEHGFRMNTAGSLQDGRRIWALADIGKDFRLMGQDRIHGYLLLGTSYDASLATVAMFTAIRVVCNNTITMAYNRMGDNAVKVSHVNIFDDRQVKFDLGIVGELWETFADQAKEMAVKKVSDEEAVKFFMDLLHDIRNKDENGDPDYSDVSQGVVGRLLNVYDSGVGQDTVSANGTAWGLVNAVSRYYDHERPTRSRSNRLNSAWFGQEAGIKRKAFNDALKLARAA